MAVFALKGTFLVRPGLSLAGCMVISAAVAGGGCKHMALDGTQLQSRSLEVSVPPNADVLIPEYSHCTLTSVSSIPSLFSAASDMYAAWLTHLNDSCDVGTIASVLAIWCLLLPSVGCAAPDCLSQLLDKGASQQGICIC